MLPSPCSDRWNWPTPRSWWRAPGGRGRRRRASAWCARRTAAPGRCSGSDPPGRRRLRPTGWASAVHQHPVQHHHRPVAAAVGIHEASSRRPLELHPQTPRRWASRRLIGDAGLRGPRYRSPSLPGVGVRVSMWSSWGLRSTKRTVSRPPVKSCVPHGQDIEVRDHRRDSGRNCMGQAAGG